MSAPRRPPSPPTDAPGTPPESEQEPDGRTTPGLPAGMLEALYARPSRKRTALVVLPVLVGLVVAAVVGAGLLWPSETERGQETAAPAVEDDTADARLEADQTTLTCWDGEPAATTQDCSLPTGPEGLRHVFPSFKPDQLECRDELVANPQYQRPAMWTCDQTLVGPVEVTYSQVSSAKSARRFLSKRHGAGPLEGEADGSRLRELWATAPVAGTQDPQLYSASILLRGAPYAVTVTAERRPDVAEALDTLVQVRPVDRLRLADPEA